MKRNDNESNFDANRRQMLAMVGQTIVAGSIGMNVSDTNAAEGTTPACVVTPQQTEGPYFVDERLFRTDVRGDPATGKVSLGVPLNLTLRIVSVSRDRCNPLADAIVDIWNCDASGIYSDVTDPSFKTVGKKFLRGYQKTNNEGEVRFVTIYPGWYPGRTIHIHFKVRTMGTMAPPVEFTSQLYFDDALSDTVLMHPAYSAHAGRRIRNQQDGIFRDGGQQLMLAPRKVGDGYDAAFNVGLADA